MKIKSSQLMFGSMNWQELKSVAKSLKVPIGKNKSATIANVTDAIAHGKAYIEFVGYIRLPQAEGSTYSPRLFMKKLTKFSSP